MSRISNRGEERSPSIAGESDLLDKEREYYANLPDAKTESQLKKFAYEHDATGFNMEPAIPFHHVVPDPMHAW